MYFIYFSHQQYLPKIGTVIISILQMGKLYTKKLSNLAKVHRFGSGNIGI